MKQKSYYAFFFLNNSMELLYNNNAEKNIKIKEGR